MSEKQTPTPGLCFDAILDNLYLGGIQGIFNLELLHQHGITHILSLMESPLPPELVEGFTYKFIYALDLYDTDLLQDIEECLEFIEHGRQAGSVLVHCQAGASRSASVVIAYIMRNCKMSRDQALEFVRKQRQIIRPNDGFMEQLQLFNNMGCRIDRNHNEFRMYTLNKLAVRFRSGVTGDQVPSNIYVSDAGVSSNDDVIYKCRKCRRPLFRSSALLTHYEGEGESAFDWHSKLPANKRESHAEDGEEKELCHASLFIEPIEWMKGKIDSIDGKLNCPKCVSKLGSYVWYGERCPCGAWVAPAFHIQRTKVDENKSRGKVTHSLQAASQKIPPPISSRSQLPIMTKTMDNGCTGIDHLPLDPK